MRPALQRLVDTGLVLRGDDGTHHLLGEAFALAAARRSGEPAARTSSTTTQPEDVAKVLRVFVRDGRITSIPTTHAKRLVVLDWLVQRFEPGRRYSEATVNLIIAACIPTPRRCGAYLVDEGMLDRDQGEYWRSGGTVPQ